MKMRKRACVFMPALSFSLLLFREPYFPPWGLCLKALPSLGQSRLVVGEGLSGRQGCYVDDEPQLLAASDPSDSTDTQHTFHDLPPSDFFNQSVSCVFFGTLSFLESPPALSSMWLRMSPNSSADFQLNFIIFKKRVKKLIIKKHSK
jgi:hypothetical protein